MPRDVCPACGSYACLVLSPAFCRHVRGAMRAGRTSVPIITDQPEQETPRAERTPRKRASRT